MSLDQIDSTLNLYAYDPRVTTRPDGGFSVQRGGADFTVEFSPNLGWTIQPTGVMGFFSADDAIKFLIGGPQ